LYLLSNIFSSVKQEAAVALIRLGKLLQDRRGDRGIREVAKEIGISAPTLSRVERGNLPDLLTFKKICAWLKINPSEFLDLPTESTQRLTASVAVHFKADKLLSPEAASDFGQLILVAQEEALRNG
jgi:transcriptional regulator with XRE-family HTH domain